MQKKNLNYELPINYKVKYMQNASSVLLEQPEILDFLIVNSKLLKKMMKAQTNFLLLLNTCYLDIVLYTVLYDLSNLYQKFKFS
jgi:hypothetical protein